MKLINSTRYSAELFRGVIEDRKLFGSIAVRVTYDLIDGRLRPAAEQIWPVSGNPWESPQGSFPGDDLFYRGGVDLLIFGAAQVPSAQQVASATRIDVEVRLAGGFHSRITAFGDRTWIRSKGTLIPSEPSPLDRVALTPENAFGGKPTWDGIEVPYADNPQGKGFYLNAEQALGQCLPNLEDPDSLIRNWEDKPEPVGTWASGIPLGPRLRRSLAFDDTTHELSELRPTFWNAAFPKMIAPSAQPGEAVEVHGVSTEGLLSFVLPSCDVRVRLRFGDEEIERTPSIDQIGIEVEERRVFISYRYPFRYFLHPLQKRSCELIHVTQ